MPRSKDSAPRTRREALAGNPRSGEAVVTRAELGLNIFERAKLTLGADTTGTKKLFSGGNRLALGGLPQAGIEQRAMVDVLLGGLAKMFVVTIGIALLLAGVLGLVSSLFGIAIHPVLGSLGIIGSAFATALGWIILKNLG